MSAPHPRFGKTIAQVEQAARAVERGERVLLVGDDDATTARLARLVRRAAAAVRGEILVAPPPERLRGLSFDELGPIVVGPVGAPKKRSIKSLANPRPRKRRTP